MSIFRRHPWHGLQIPEPASDAPREQVMEWAALAGAGAAYMCNIEKPMMRRVMRTYVERWLPDFVLPPDDA